MTEMIWASRTPARFAQMASHGRWEMAPHLTALDTALTDTIRGVDGIRRLMVFMPPRHGKSELCCKYLPAWYLGTFPENQVVVAGYGHQFASEWGQKSRDIMTEWGPKVFDVAVRKDIRSV